MYESLPPKEIARIKRESRDRRIRQIRRFVATGAISLVTLFSGVILTRSLASQNPTRDSAANTLGQFVDSSSDDEHESDDGEESNFLSDVAAGVSSAITSSTPDSSSDPAPSPAPVTTSQS